MIKGYIFDYGGTLDTAGCHWGRMIWHSYQKARVPVNWEQFRAAYIHAERMLGRNPIIQSSYTFRQTLDMKLRIEMEYLVSKGYWYDSPLEHSLRHAGVLDDLYGQVRAETARSREVLERLRGKYPLVLVSNFYGNITVVLREFGLDGIFSDIIESAAVGVRKPDPRIFALGVEALGMSPDEVTVVGDSLAKDIIPAKSLGCHTVWIKGEAWEDTPQDSSAADKVISSLAELVAE